MLNPGTYDTAYNTAYDTGAVLRQVDQHTIAVLGLCAVALIGNYIFWIETLRHGYRHRVYSMPLPCIYFFLCHDLTFVASYHTWFHDINHWFPKLWWAGLVLTCFMEITFLAMFLRFGRRELAPQLSQRSFTIATLTGLALTLAPWLVIKSVMDDQLYLVIFGFTVFWCAPWYLALMWRRQNPAGQTITGWIAYLLMPLAYWPATMILSPGFRTGPWIALGIATVIGGLANIACIRWLRTRNTDPAGPHRHNSPALPTPS